MSFFSAMNAKMNDANLSGTISSIDNNEESRITQEGEAYLQGYTNQLENYKSQVQGMVQEKIEGGQQLLEGGAIAFATGRKLVSTVGSQIESGVYGRAATAIGSKLENLPSAVADTATELGQTATELGQSLVGVAGRAASSIGDAVSDAASSIASATSNTFYSMTGRFQSIYGENQAASLQEAVASADPEAGIGAMLDSARMATTSITRVGTELSGDAQSLIGSTRAIGSSLLQSVKSSADTALTEATGAAQAARITAQTGIETGAQGATNTVTGAVSSTSAEIAGAGAEEVAEGGATIGALTAGETIAEGAIAAIPVVGEVAALAGIGYGIYEGIKDLFSSGPSKPPAPVADTSGSAGVQEQTDIASTAQAGLG
jgi:hypothetical protein